jgi:hypothetical protein
MENTDSNKHFQEKYLERFKKARTARTVKLENLPFARKIAIIEKMQADRKTIEDSIRTLK